MPGRGCVTARASRRRRAGQSSAPAYWLSTSGGRAAPPHDPGRSEREAQPELEPRTLHALRHCFQRVQTVRQPRDGRGVRRAPRRHSSPARRLISSRPPRTTGAFAMHGQLGGRLPVVARRTRAPARPAIAGGTGGGDRREGPRRSTPLVETLGRTRTRGRCCAVRRVDLSLGHEGTGRAERDARTAPRRRLDPPRAGAAMGRVGLSNLTLTDAGDILQAPRPPAVRRSAAAR